MAKDVASREAGNRRTSPRPVASWSWADPAVVSRALGDPGLAHPLAVDPGGDLALALAIAGAGAVTHATSDPAAHALVSLKLVAARELPVEGYRCLLGLDPAGRRVFYYHLVRSALPDPVRAWWDEREELIRLGVSTAGVWERHLEGYRLRVLPMLRVQGVVDELLRERDSDAARRLLREQLDRTSWRMATRAWFGSPVMSALGPGGLPSGWLDRALDGLCERPPADNFLARFALTGDFGDLEHAWPQLSRLGHAALARASRRVHLVLADPAELLAEQPVGTFTSLAAGPLGEWSPLLERAAERLQVGGRLVAWMAGARPELLPGLRLDQELALSLRAQDRAAFLGPVLVGEVERRR